MKTAMTLTAASLFALATVGCDYEQDPDPVVEVNTEEMERELEEAGRDLERGAEAVGREAREGAEAVADETEEAADKVERELED